MVRRTKINAAQTRDRILEQAGALFEENGYTATTLDDIAAPLGLTKGAIFYHFKNKKMLFTTIWTQLQTELHTLLFTTAAEVARRSKDPFAGILASARIHIEYGHLNKRYKNIVMKDGPKVLGMDDWIEREAKFGLARVQDGLNYLAYKKVLSDTDDLDHMARLMLGTLNYASLMMREKTDSGALIRKFEQLVRGLDTRPMEERNIR